MKFLSEDSNPPYVNIEDLTVCQVMAAKFANLSAGVLYV